MMMMPSLSRDGGGLIDVLYGGVVQRIVVWEVTNEQRTLAGRWLEVWMLARYWVLKQLKASLKSDGMRPDAYRALTSADMFTRKIFALRERYLEINPKKSKIALC